MEYRAGTAWDVGVVQQIPTHIIREWVEGEGCHMQNRHRPETRKEDRCPRAFLLLSPTG